MNLFNRHFFFIQLPDGILQDTGNGLKWRGRMCRGIGVRKMFQTPCQHVSLFSVFTRNKHNSIDGDYSGM